MSIEFIQLPEIQQATKVVMSLSAAIVVVSLLVVLQDLHGMPESDSAKDHASLHVWALMVAAALLGLGEGVKFLEAVQGVVHSPPSVATNTALAMLCLWSLRVRPIRRWASAIYACRLHRNERGGEYYLSRYEEYAEPPFTILPKRGK